MKIGQKKIYTLAKFLISLILIYILILKIDRDSLLMRIGSINIYWLSIMLILPHIGILICSIKWQWLLKALGVTESLSHLSILYLMGTFFNNFLPTMAGGDVVRVFQLTKKTSNPSAVIAATFAERFLGITALVTFFFLILFYKNIYDVIPAIIILALVLFVIIGYIVILLLVFHEKYLSYLAPLNRFKVLANIINLLVNSQSKILQFKDKKRAVFTSYLLSLLFYVIAMLTVYAGAQSLNIHVDMKVIIVVVPLVLTVGLLPITLNGLGLNEASYVFFFTLFGLSGIDAFSIALLLRTRILLTGLLGGLTFIFYDKSVPNESGISRSIQSKVHNTWPL